MNSIIWFKNCGLNNINLIGGKNSSLGELYKLSNKQNINIADGFSITTKMYEKFIKYNNLNLKINNYLNLLQNNYNNINNISVKLKNIILNSKFKKEDEEIIIKSFNELKKLYKLSIQVAVRSSAIGEDSIDASFAGQQDTYLNITNNDKLIESIIKCYSSLFNSRAISYRFNNNISFDNIKISVGIQKMVRSDLGSSGVAFSLDPNNGYNKSILINSSWGLGELIVSGGIKPDEFIIDKRTINSNDPILVKRLGYKKEKMVYGNNNICIENTSNEEFKNFSLNDNQIKELSKVVLKLETYYSKLYGKNISIDVEWAVDGIDNKIYIIQTRPETVFSNSENNTITTYKLLEKSKLICKGLSVGNKISTGKVKYLNSIDQYNLFKKGDILVTNMTTPDWEPIMKISNGIITNKGGSTCHAAIVARELGINACVGTINGTELLSNIQEVTLDCSNGTFGNIYEGKLNFSLTDMKINTDKKVPVKLMLNIGSPENCFEHSLLPQCGVGLARLEFIINNYIKIHPLALCDYPDLPNELKLKITNIIGNKTGKDFFIYELSHGIAKIASSFYPNKVIVRLSDFKSNEYKSLLGGNIYEPNEENPMIGWRGASRYYSEKYLKAFELECLSIKYAREEMLMDNIIVMIPFCRTPEECKKVIQLMEDYGLVRGKNGLEIYLMCEIPSNVIEADVFSKYIDGVSIGGNDLLQLTLGVDRDSELIKNLSDHTNISYRRLIKSAIEDYHKYGVKVGFCGQQPSDSDNFCDFLISNKIDSISVTPDSLLKTFKNLSID